MDIARRISVFSKTLLNHRQIQMIALGTGHCALVTGICVAHHT
jgi:hypothetical protein